MDETLIFQLVDDLQDLFNNTPDFSNVVVKKSYDGDDSITYPCVIVSEIENTDNSRYYDLQEHVVNVAYQFTILSESSSDDDAYTMVYKIMCLIKDYMRGERYHSLRRTGDEPIVNHPNDDNIKIGYMRYTGCIDIDNNIIYRRTY
jgi:hypothetical protein